MVRTTKPNSHCSRLLQLRAILAVAGCAFGRLPPKEARGVARHQQFQPQQAGFSLLKSSRQLTLLPAHQNTANRGSHFGSAAKGASPLPSCLSLERSPSVWKPCEFSGSVSPAGTALPLLHKVGPLPVQLAQQTNQQQPFRCCGGRESPAEFW